MGAWSVILPEAGTNKVLSPVAQGALTVTYALVGTSTIGLDTDASQAYSGYKHYHVVTDADNEGISLVLSALANAIHYVTVRTYGAPTAAWDWNLNGATMNVPTLLGYEGPWYVYGFQFPAVECNGSVALQILTRGVAVNEFKIGHIQVEQNTYPTTPITGDMRGFCSDGYYWNGTAHASSSTRAAKERSGGKVVDLDTTYNFTVKYGDGSGMPPITHHVQGMALLPGSLYQGHHIEPRVLDLVSATKANTTSTVAAARKNFINTIKPDRVSPEQPIVFRYTAVNSTKPVDFHAYYDSGMEFQTAKGIIDEPVARFICYDPFVYETHTESALLTVGQFVADMDYVARKVNGNWANISDAFNNIVYDIVIGRDGCVYIGGLFTDLGGADGDRIIKWDPFASTLSALGTGMSDNGVFALAVAPNGDIYAGGVFASAGGVAETDNLAYWDLDAGPAAWKSVTAVHPNSGIFCLTFDHSGNLYVGGAFTNLGDGSGDYIAKFTSAGWVSLGTGMNGAVNDIAVAPNGDIYATGAFALAGGVAGTAYIAYWDVDEAVPAWHPLGTGLSGGTPVGYRLIFDKAGNLYVGGNFTTADGVACANIAKWNGKTFESLGSGLNNSCWSLAFDANGLLYAGGGFTSAGGIVLSDKLASWNGSIWAHIDVDLPGAAVPAALAFSGNDFYESHNTTGSATTSYLNTITNNGSTSAYPIIKVTRTDAGAGIFTSDVVRLEWIKNETTGDILYCDYDLAIGETLTIDLTPGNRSIKSDFLGDVWRAVLRSSDFSTFRLMPGENKISAFINPVGGVAITGLMWMEWPITHWGADNVAA